MHWLPCRCEEIRWGQVGTAPCKSYWRPYRAFYVPFVRLLTPVGLAGSHQSRTKHLRAHCLVSFARLSRYCPHLPVRGDPIDYQRAFWSPGHPRHLASTIPSRFERVHPFPRVDLREYLMLLITSSTFWAEAFNTLPRNICNRSLAPYWARDGSTFAEQ